MVDREFHVPPGLTLDTTFFLHSVLAFCVLFPADLLGFFFAIFFILCTTLTIHPSHSQPVFQGYGTISSSRVLIKKSVVYHLPICFVAVLRFFVLKTPFPYTYTTKCRTDNIVTNRGNRLKSPEVQRSALSPLLTCTHITPEKEKKDCYSFLFPCSE